MTLTTNELLEEEKRETKRHFLDYLKKPEDETKAQALIQSNYRDGFIKVDVPNDPIIANRSLQQKALKIVEDMKKGTVSKEKAMNQFEKFISDYFLDFLDEIEKQTNNYSSSVPQNALSPRVFYDCDGWFLTEIIKGAEQGFHVSDMITNVLYTDDKGSRSVTERDSFKLFPCIIVVKKKYIKNLIRKMESALKTGGMNDSDNKQYEESKKMLEDCIHNYELHLKKQFSFFNNSSIWVRLVDWDDDAIKNAQKELEYFKYIKLYEYGSAKENLDYSIRLQKQNYLKEDHGKYVTPLLYGNESKFGELLFNEP